MHNCKACNSLYKPRINPFTDGLEDLCSDCLVEARFSAYGIEEDIDYNEVEDILDTLDMGVNGIYNSK
jgi:hypothetical protein